MNKDLKIRFNGMAVVMIVALGFFMLLPACGGGNGGNQDADADTHVDPVGDEGEATVDVPAEDTPSDPVQDEAAGETPEAADGVDAADVPVDDHQDADAAETECTPPLVYHPGFDTCVSTEGIGNDCTASDCQQGQDCVEFTGIGGNVFHRCHISCGPEPQRLCPAGWDCEDVSDGPQNVCGR